MVVKKHTTAIALSRKVALVMGIFNGCSALGGFAIGITLSNGQFVAMAALSAAICLSSVLWRYYTRETLAGFQLLALISFCGASGLALYLNLVYVVWFIGLPLSIGAVQNGAMERHIYSGPLVLFYALFCWLGLKIAPNGK